jgi:hypothetical protein
MNLRYALQLFWHDTPCYTLTFEDVASISPALGWIITYGGRKVGMIVAVEADLTSSTLGLRLQNIVTDTLQEELLSLLSRGWMPAPIWTERLNRASVEAVAAEMTKGFLAYYTPALPEWRRIP